MRLWNCLSNFLQENLFTVLGIFATVVFLFFAAKGNIIMRTRMRFCLWRLEKLWYENNDTVSGNAALEFSNTRGKLKVLKNLQSAGCVKLSFQDNSNRPVIIRSGENSSIYTLERSEMWLNRIIGFIAGILTTVLADYITRLLP